MNNHDKFTNEPVVTEKKPEYPNHIERLANESESEYAERLLNEMLHDYDDEEIIRFIDFFAKNIPHLKKKTQTEMCQVLYGSYLRTAIEKGLVDKKNFFDLAIKQKEVDRIFELSDELHDIIQKNQELLLSLMNYKQIRKAIKKNQMEKSVVFDFLIEKGVLHINKIVMLYDIFLSEIKKATTEQQKMILVNMLPSQIRKIIETSTMEKSFVSDVISELHNYTSIISNFPDIFGEQIKTLDSDKKKEILTFSTPDQLKTLLDTSVIEKHFLLDMFFEMGFFQKIGILCKELAEDIQKLPTKQQEKIIDNLHGTLFTKVFENNIFEQKLLFDHLLKTERYGYLAMFPELFRERFTSLSHETKRDLLNKMYVYQLRPFLENGLLDKQYVFDLLLSEHKLSRIKRLSDLLEEQISNSDARELISETEVDTTISEITEKYLEEFYFSELKANPEIEDTIRSNIKVTERINQKEYKHAAHDLGIGIEEFKHILQKRSESLVEESDLFCALPSDVLVHILNNDTRIKSQFETNTSLAALDPGFRAEVEYKMFGFTKDTQINREYRPIYGFCSDDVNGMVLRTNNQAYPSLMRRYGNVNIKFKRKSIEKRTTVCFAAALFQHETDFEYIVTPFTRPHFTSIPMLHINNLDLRRSTSSMIGEYAETQYHNQLTLCDVEALYVSLNNKINPNEIKQLSEALATYNERHPESTIQLIEF